MGTRVGGPGRSDWSTMRSDTGRAAMMAVTTLLVIAAVLGVPVHAHQVYPQTSLTQLDHFEVMAFLNWRPSFDAINRSDRSYTEPWQYYEFTSAWTIEGAPYCRSRNQFSRTWMSAEPRE